MRKIFTNRLLLLLPIFLMAFSSLGCAKNMSIKESETWFYTNIETLKSLNQILLDHPSIHRVDPGIRIELVAKYDNFDSETELAYQKASSLCQDNGIVGISVSREGGHKHGEILSISYTLKSVGIGPSGGSSISVERIYKESLLNSFNDDEYTIFSTKEKGWYLINYSDNI